MSRSRIELTDTAESALIKMCDGNPGALQVMLAAMKQEPSIDPDSAFAGLGAVFAFDTHGIYGARIWMLFKVVCGQSIVLTLAALRAVQLGLESEAALLKAIDAYGRGFDPLAAYRKVKARLPAFGELDEAGRCLESQEAQRDTQTSALADTH